MVQIFDPTRPFVVGKAMTYKGKFFKPGTPFDTSALGNRELRILYDRRYLVMTEDEPAPVQEPVEGAAEKPAKEKKSGKKKKGVARKRVQLPEGDE